MVKRTLFLFFIIMLFSGCAAKSQFVYEHPDAKPDTPMASSVAVLTPVADHRTGDKKIDTIFKENPIASVQHVIQEELLDTGLFREVMTIDKMNSGTDIANDKADVVVYTELRKMEWFVPDYDQIVATAFTASLLTGGLGGLAYGSTSTDVIGNSAIFVRVVDRKSGTELLSKEYTGSYTEGMTKLSCDTPETKAKMVGKSLKVALEELKSDLKTVGFSNDKVASVVVGN